MDKLQIKCPHCGAVLTVRNQPGIERLAVTCPVCKQRPPFTSFQPVMAQPRPMVQDDSATQYAGRPTGGYPGGPTSQFNMAEHPEISSRPGRLLIAQFGMSYQLKEGRNVLGRMSPSTKADFKIPCQNNRTSREHLIITVTSIPGAGYKHTATLAKPEVNRTGIGSAILEPGDTVVLRPGDIIRLPDAPPITFEIPQN